MKATVPQQARKATIIIPFSYYILDNGNKADYRPALKRRVFIYLWFV
jgi:hypothetical protein